MDAGTVGALDAGPSPLDTCTTDNYFHCGEGSDFPPGFGPCCIEGYCASCPEFAPVVRAVALFPVALVLNLVVRTACVTAVITVVAILKAMRVDTVQIPLAMVSTAATGFAEGPITFCALIIDPCYHGETDGTADGDAEGSSEGSTSGGGGFGNGSP